jgi:hypothetical protein
MEGLLNGKERVPERGISPTVREGSYSSAMGLSHEEASQTRGPMHRETMQVIPRASVTSTKVL